MPLVINPLGDNPQQPGIYAETYLPDQLLAGRFMPVTENITLGAGTLQRGTVLGQQTLGAAASVAGKPAGGANTGNGTISAVALEANAAVGAYVITMTGATTFTVEAPDGAQLAGGETGVAYNDRIGFTITAGGTAFTAGDGFTVTVAAGSGNFVASVATAADGSQVPAAILADYADASGGAVVAPAYLTGEFNQDKVTFDASWTLAALTPLLRARSIFLKSFVSAADPT
ncbi:MAG: head decoration protein [Betaproteobacteria bacterium]|nr:head decoration protein [Betaproteobacteria bacterium]